MLIDTPCDWGTCEYSKFIYSISSICSKRKKEEIMVGVDTDSHYLQEVLWRMGRKGKKNQRVRDIPKKGPSRSTDQDSFGA